MSEYESDLEPLMSMLEIIFELEVKKFLELQHQKYASEILSNSGSKHEIEDFLKSIVTRLQSTLLSKSYITKLINKYYSEEGLQLTIFYFIYDKCMEYLKQK